MRAHRVANMVPMSCQCCGYSDITFLTMRLIVIYCSGITVQGYKCYGPKCKEFNFCLEWYISIKSCSFVFDFKIKQGYLLPTHLNIEIFKLVRVNYYRSVPVNLNIFKFYNSGNQCLYSNAVSMSSTCQQEMYIYIYSKCK